MAGKRKAKAETAGAGGGVATLAPAAGATQAPTTRSGELEVTYATIPLIDIAESPHNPRKHFDPGALEELSASIREQGIWEPLLVRPHPAQADIYELASGHRRFRAAKLAGLEQVPCIVRPLDDATFLEVLTVANLQREDVHPLEETDGYVEMMKSLGWDVPTIAKKVGKGETYIYDRLKFQVLIKPIRELFFTNRITPAHAIELSRITAAQQQLCVQATLEQGSGGLWQREGGDEDQLDLDEEQEDPTAGLKVVTVRELKSWIQVHCRFVAAEVDPVLFPETVRNVTEAANADLKIVSITREYRVHDDAKAEGQRTYGTQSWKRADGQEDPHQLMYGEKQIAKTCEHAVLGVVVAGVGRSESFPVCIARDKCKVHWSKEMKKKASAASNGASRNADVARREQSWERENRLREERRAAFKPAIPAVVEALLAKVESLPFKIDGMLHKAAGRDFQVSAAAMKRLGKPKSAEDLVRLRAADRVLDSSSEYSAADGLPKLGKELGVDVDKIAKAHAPAPAKDEAEAGDAKPAAKKAAKKKTKARK